jgi:hypothetical protein
LNTPQREPRSPVNQAGSSIAPRDADRETRRGPNDLERTSPDLASRNGEPLPKWADGSRESALEHAIETLTRRLPYAADDEITELVRERRAMREELAALREGNAGNVLPFAKRRS